jgi:Domain of unknown function (DUF5122) beta-propeller
MLRVCGAVIVAAWAVFATACNNDNNNGNTASNQPPSFNNAVLSITLAADGSGDVYVGGDFTTYDGAQAIRIVRLNADGTIDPSFATGVGFNGSVRSIVPAGTQGGAIYVGGDFTTYNGIQRFRMMRITANGSLDQAFVAGAGTGFDNTVHVIAPAGDGSGDIYVGGAFINYNGIPVNRIVRLNADGTVDPALFIGTGFNNTVFTIVPAADGSGDLYVGGAFTSYRGVPANNLVRLNADGSPDATFVTGMGFDNAVQMIALADNSGLYVGGAFTNYDGSPANGLVRLNSNGVINPFLATGTGFNNTVFHVVPTGDGSGDLYVAGGFTSYNGAQANELIRLNQNGTIDLTFATGTGFGNTVLRVVPVGDGSGDVYTGGQFVQYQSTPIGRFVRLNSTGAFIR